MAEVDPDYSEATREALELDEAILKSYEAPGRPALSVAQRAANLPRLAPANYLYGAATALLGPAFDVPVFEVYLAGYLRDAGDPGDPGDPGERMLLEQLAWAHHVLGRLHVQAGSRDNAEESAAFHAAAARLMGEFRQSALALKSYRQPAATPSAAATAGAVKQAPLAATPVAAGDAEARKGAPPAAFSRPGRRQKKDPRKSEQESSNHVDGFLIHDREPAAA
jgi:hypothetical protein